MGEAVLYGQSSGGKKVTINGIIEQYKVANNKSVSVNDFVEFINFETGRESFTSSTTKISYKTDSAQGAYAVPLSDNRVFLAYNDGQLGTAVYGSIIRIDNGATITILLQDKVIVSSGASITTLDHINLVKIDDTHLYLMYRSASTAYQLRGVGITVSGSDFTYTSNGSLAGTTAYTGYTFSSVLLDADTIFVAHSYGESYYLYGTILKFSNGVYQSAVTSKITTNTSNFKYSISVAKLSPNQVVVCAGYNTSYQYLTIFHLSISGTTIIVNGSKNEEFRNAGRYQDCVALDGSRVFVAFSGESYHYLYGMVIGISSGSITTGTKFKLTTDSYSCYKRMKISLLDNGNVCIPYATNSSYYYSRAVIVKIDGNSVSTASSFVEPSSEQYSGSGPSAIQLENGNILLLHGVQNGGYLHGLVCSASLEFSWQKITAETGLQKTTSSKFLGVAKSSGISGEEVEVYTLLPPKPTIFGFKIDTTNSNPSTSVSYIEGSDRMSPATVSTLAFNDNGWLDVFPFNKIRPVILDSAGKVIAEVNKNNFKQRIDGSSVTSSENIFIEIPPVYWKIEKVGSNVEVRWSDEKIDNTYKALAHSRGSILKGNLYVGAYQASVSNSKLYSTHSSSISVNKTVLSNLDTYASNVGSGFRNFTYYTTLLLQILFVGMFKTLDSQSIMYGRDTQSPTTGDADDKGMYYGSSNYNSIKFIGIENLWGNYYTAVSGIYVRSSSIVAINDGTVSYSSYNSYPITISGSFYSTLHYPKEYSATTEGGFLSTSSSTGSNSTYLCDQQRFHTSYPFADFGSSYSSTGSGGIFYYNFYWGYEEAHSTAGRLEYLAP